MLIMSTAGSIHYNSSPLSQSRTPKISGKKVGSPTQHAILKNKVRALEMGTSMFKGPVGLGASSLC